MMPYIQEHTDENGVIAIMNEERTCLSAPTQRRHCSNAGSDCIILTSEYPQGPSLVARQVIEGLRYIAEEKRVEITLIIELENPHSIAARARVVHRGDISGWIEPFTFESEEPALRLLSRLYSDRIVCDPNGEGTVLFYPRVNCLAVSHKPIEVSLKGPSGCFANGQRHLELEPESPRGLHPSFTSFLLPPVEPDRKELFVLNLRLESTTYEYLLEQRPWFSVSSYTRLLSDIAAFDVEFASKESRILFNSNIAPNNAHLVPEAYDIIIFQALGNAVEVMDGSVCILPVRHSDKELAEKVLWFYGNPVSEFYLELCYQGISKVEHPRSFVASGHC
ncbi:hypothetical protein ACFL6U_16275 [Planctomycetota bacterium]